MKCFKIERSNADIVSHSGLALIGQVVKHYTDFSSEVDAQVALHHGVKHSDVLKSNLAMQSIGKNDFETINTVESDFYFVSAMGIDDIPCEATFRQRMDKYADRFLPLVEKASQDYLMNIQPMFSVRKD